MNIPLHWLTEHRLTPDKSCMMHLRASSDVSMEEARRRLEQRAEERAAFLKEHSWEDEAGERRARGEYETEIFEMTVQRLDEANIITRNRYGAQVLNSTEICFVDVDEVPQGLGELLRSLIGMGRSAEVRLQELLRELCREDERLSARLYRTAAGFRVVLAGQGIELNSPRTEALFRRLHADARYAELCRRQQCWRARLTPKPHRIGCKAPVPQADSESAAAELAAWVPGYEQQSEPYAVCRLVCCMGTALHHPVLELHDEMTGARKSDRRLA